MFCPASYNGNNKDFEYMLTLYLSHSNKLPSELIDEADRKKAKRSKSKVRLFLLY